MNRSISLVLVLIFLTVSCIIIIPAKALADSWVTKAPMPSAIAGGVSIALNDKIYVIGPNFTFVYNTSTNTWVSKTPIPTHQQSFAVATSQNKIYVSGGCNGFNPTTGYPINCTGANEEYNPASDTWVTKASMPTARAEMQANGVNGKIYVIGGTLPNGTISNATEVYDPASDSWVTAASILTPVGLYSSAVVDNKIYIEGGGKNGPAITDLNQIYDSKTNAWTMGESLPTPSLLAAAGATTGVLAPVRLYVIGGTTDGINALNTTHVYDPQADSWTVGASMPSVRGFLSVAVANDTLYALGGTNNLLSPQSSLNAVNEQYFPLGYGEPSPTPPILRGTEIYYLIAVVVLIIILTTFLVTLFLRRRHSRLPAR